MTRPIRLTRSRQYLLATLMVAFALSMLAPRAGAQERTDLNFAYFPAFHTMSVMLAAEGGFFERNGLNVNMIPTASGSLLIPTVLSGDAHLTTGNISNIARLRVEGRSMMFIYPTVGRMSLNMVVRQDTLDRLGVTPDSPLQEKYEALCQMTIGYTSPNAPTDVFTRYYLRAGGCDPSRAELVSIGGQGPLLAAMRAGRIDGFQLTPPSPNLAVIEGFGVIFIKPTAGEVPELDNFPYTGIVATQLFLDQNPTTTAAFIKSLLEASEFAQTNPEEAVDLLQAYFPDMEAEVLLAGFEDMRPALPETGLLTESYVQNYLDINWELGMLETTIEEAPVEEGILWTNQYTEMALEQLGR